MGCGATWYVDGSMIDGESPLLRRLGVCIVAVQLRGQCYALSTHPPHDSLATLSKVIEQLMRLPPPLLGLPLRCYCASTTACFRFVASDSAPAARGDGCDVRRRLQRNRAPSSWPGDPSDLQSNNHIDEWFVPKLSVQSAIPCNSAPPPP